MTFWQAVFTCFEKYFDFEGRAERREFWFWFLFTWAGSIATGIMDAAIYDTSIEEVGLFGALFLIATFCPNLAVMVRRFHDINRSGWWILWFILIYIGVVVVMFGIGGLVGGSAGGFFFFLGGLGAVGVFIWWVVWMATKGTAGHNHFGAPPIAATPENPEPPTNPFA